MHTSSITSSDILEVESRNNAIGWDLRYVRLDHGDFEAHSQQSRVGDTRILRETFSGPLHVFGRQKSDFRAVALATEPFSGLRWMGESVGFNDLIVAEPGDEFDLVTGAELGLWTVMLSPHRVDAVAKDLGVEAFATGRSHLARLSPSAARTLRSSLTRLCDPGTDAVTAAGLEARFLQILIGDLTRNDRPAILEFPSTARVRHARTAREFIDANFTSPLRMEQICSAAGTSARTLQRSFQEVFGTTPLVYARTRRLDLVRRTLRESRGATSVSEAARAAGFEHLGRFAGRYRAMFGESPRETLAGNGTRDVG